MKVSLLAAGLLLLPHLAWGEGPGSHTIPADALLATNDDVATTPCEQVTVAADVGPQQAQECSPLESRWRDLSFPSLGTIRGRCADSTSLDNTPCDETLDCGDGRCAAGPFDILVQYRSTVTTGDGCITGSLSVSKQLADLTTDDTLSAPTDTDVQAVPGTAGEMGHLTLTGLEAWDHLGAALCTPTTCADAYMKLFLEVPFNDPNDPIVDDCGTIRIIQAKVKWPAPP